MFVNLLDLAKSFLTSIYLQNWLRYSRERASKSLPKISQRLELRIQLRKNIDLALHPLDEGGLVRLLPVVELLVVRPVSVVLGDHLLEGLHHAVQDGDDVGETCAL